MARLAYWRELIGCGLVTLLRDGPSVGQGTLTRFYAGHTILLPVLTTVFMLRQFEIARSIRLLPYNALGFSAPIAVFVSVFLIYPLGGGVSAFSFILFFQGFHNWTLITNQIVWADKHCTVYRPSPLVTSGAFWPSDFTSLWRLRLASIRQSAWQVFTLLVSGLLPVRSRWASAMEANSTVSIEIASGDAAIR